LTRSFAAIGAVLGGLVLGVALLNARRLDRRVSGFHDACEHEAKSSQNAEAMFVRKLGGSLVCDPFDLASSKDSDPPGVQGELARAQRQQTRWQEWQTWLIPAGLIILVVSGLPWSWYFLLRRIRELSAAISGK
jgi:hypothetical protein